MSQMSPTINSKAMIPVQFGYVFTELFAEISQQYTNHWGQVLLVHNQISIKYNREWDNPGGEIIVGNTDLS